MNIENGNECMKYDVFISAKSEDYNLAEGVLKFLERNGLSVFLANQELRKIGMSQYAEAIDMALDAATHMIVVASCIDYIRSPFVHYEWSVFSNDLKSGYRTGNLLTVLTDGISLRELPPSLRHQQSYCIDTYQHEILGYLGRQEIGLPIVCQGKSKNRRHRILINTMLALCASAVLCLGIALGIWREKAQSLRYQEEMTAMMSRVLCAKENVVLEAQKRKSMGQMDLPVKSGRPKFSGAPREWDN
ncbi:MAG: toll/interleukin-1 receptor domain-containing protein [Kiritimatiellae bacterium]|nr:toll/interleukin-1 receptor domain-containing protein [Kiritimatiellia bacterium]